MLSKQDVIRIRHQLQEALQNIELDEGVTLKLGNASYSANNITFKLDVSVPNENGETISKEGEDFKVYAHRFGMTPENLGSEFNDHEMGVCKIIGCKPRSHKYPILVETTRGKIYKFPADRVVRGLNAVAI